MPDSARPDLFAYMDAYRVLGLEYSADPSQIRGAHRRLARQHHPDKQQAGSPEQQRATVRMAEINDAYGLVREAPLRYHRVSKATTPDTPWTDSELDEAIRRSQANRNSDLVTTVAPVMVAIVVAVALVPFVLSHGGPLLSRGHLGFPIQMGITLAWIVLVGSLGPRIYRTLFKLELALIILRMISFR